VLAVGTLLPWVFFLMATALTSLGTFSPAAVALLGPAALGLAYESRIHPVLMGAFVVNGAHAGGFSPLSVAGVLVHDPWTLVTDDSADPVQVQKFRDAGG
jgi:Na+/H+ antiporter NhaC